MIFLFRIPMNITMDVLIAIIQSNLTAYSGIKIEPEVIKSICAEIKESLEHHKETKE